MTHLDTTSVQLIGKTIFYRIVNSDGSLGGWADERVTFTDQDSTYISPAVMLSGPMVIKDCILGSAHSAGPLVITATEDTHIFPSTLTEVTWDGQESGHICAGHLNLTDVTLGGTVTIPDTERVHLTKTRLTDTLITVEHKIDISGSILNKTTIATPSTLSIDKSTLGPGHYTSEGALRIYNSNLHGLGINTKAQIATFDQVRCFRDPMWATEELTLTEHDVLINHTNPLFPVTLNTCYNRNEQTYRFISATGLWSPEELAQALTAGNLTIDGVTLTEAQHRYVAGILAQSQLLSQLAA